MSYAATLKRDSAKMAAWIASFLRDRNNTLDTSLPLSDVIRAAAVMIGKRQVGSGVERTVREELVRIGRTIVDIVGGTLVIYRYTRSEPYSTSRHKAALLEFIKYEKELNNRRPKLTPKLVKSLQ